MGRGAFNRNECGYSSAQRSSLLGGGERTDGSGLSIEFRKCKKCKEMFHAHLYDPEELTTKLCVICRRR